MIFFKKNKEQPLDLSWLNTDIHSHLLPGIDDGSQDTDTSLKLIKGMVELGYKKLVTTPHILWEIYPNTPEIIKAKTKELKTAIASEGIEVEFHSAAEYFLDDHFEQQLNNKLPLLPVRLKMVLVEFSMLAIPIDFQSIIFQMQMQNYQPLIAHPERYAYLRYKKDFFEQLKDKGCFFQLNLLSLTGYYGNTVLELADYLIKKKYYNFAGTDLHNERHLHALQKLSGSALYKRLRDSGTIKNYLL